MTDRIEDFITSINNCKSPEAAFNELSNIAKEFGYDRLIYTYGTDHPSVGLEAQHGLVTNYPEDWLNHYAENNYAADDIVYRHMMTSPLPCFWSDMTDDNFLSPTALKILRQGEEADVVDGMGIPLLGPMGEIAGVGFARSHCEAQPDYATLGVLQLVVTYFHEAYKQMVRPTAPVELTVKERELLLWAAEGKTDLEISDILCISLPTVRYRWMRVFEKLEANGRVYAITKALRLGLIAPGVIRDNNHSTWLELWCDR